MGAYTATCLAAPWLLGLLGCAQGFAADPDPGSPAAYDQKTPDAGPTDCSLQGTWNIQLSNEEHCAPQSSGAFIVLTVDENPGSDDFETSAPDPASTCGAYTHEVQVAADGCTITTSSLARWCASGEPQCNDYQLTLHVRGDEAEVEGNYRRCWCGSPSAFGTKVDVVGHAFRR